MPFSFFDIPGYDAISTTEATSQCPRDFVIVNFCATQTMQNKSTKALQTGISHKWKKNVSLVLLLHFYAFLSACYSTHSILLFVMSLRAPTPRLLPLNWLREPSRRLLASIRWGGIKKKNKCPKQEKRVDGFHLNSDSLGVFVKASLCLTDRHLQNRSFI